MTVIINILFFVLCMYMLVLPFRAWDKRKKRKEGDGLA